MPVLFSFKSPKYCTLSDEIFFKYNNKLKEKGLYLEGFGGAFMDDIKEIGAYYVTFKPMTVEDARLLYIEVVEGILKVYNDNEIIRPFLHNYPFSFKNLKIRIEFDDECHCFRSGGLVAAIFPNKGCNIVYMTYDLQKQELVDLYSEPYETALEIVRKEHPECLTSSSSENSLHDTKSRH